MLAFFREAAWLDADRATAWRRVFLGFGGLVLVAVLGWAVVSGGDALDPWGRPVGTDFICFYAASALALAGRPAAAYDIAAHLAAQVAAAPGLELNFPFFYPPVFLLMALPLALLPYLGALAAWLLVTGGAYLAAMQALLPRRWTWAAALAFPAVLVTAAHGQTALLTTALFGFAALWLDRRPVLAGVCIGLLCFKPHLAVLAPVALAAGGRWPAFVAAAATVLGLVGLSALVFGLDAWAAFLAQSSLARAVLEMNGIGFGKIQSVFAAVQMLGGGIGLAYGMQAVVAIAAAIGIAWAARRGADGMALGAALAAGAALTSPYMLDYDLLVLAVPMAWLLARPDGFRPWEKILLAAVFLLPILARPIGTALGLPIAPPLTIALFCLVLRRAGSATGR